MAAFTQITSIITPTPTSITSAPSISATATESGSSNSISSSRPPQIHTVKAGAGGFNFEPAELKDVNVGDTVTFEFYPPDHSVARAEFGYACVPYEYTGSGKTGFWSDTQWVKDVDHLTHYNVTVNSTEPIFFYCAAPESCTGHQMVGVINPNDTQTLDAQISAAKEAAYQLRPGDPVPAEGTASLHVSATASPTSSSSPSSSSHSHNLSGGAIAGIVVGAVAFLAICAALFFYVGRTKSLKEVLAHNKEAGSTTPGVRSPAVADGSAFPGSPGFVPAGFSQGLGYAEQGMGGGGHLPAYGQHNATDGDYGRFSPASVQAHSEMAEMKSEYVPPAELASPPPGQTTFQAELEAPVKGPR